LFGVCLNTIVSLIVPLLKNKKSDLRVAKAVLKNVPDIWFLRRIFKKKLAQKSTRNWRRQRLRSLERMRTINAKARAPGMLIAEVRASLGLP
jgi:hypothetical protein